MSVQESGVADDVPKDPAPRKAKYHRRSNSATRGLLILVACLTVSEHKTIFLLCHYFARDNFGIESCQGRERHEMPPG
jgi:hypothetical protein